MSKMKFVNEVVTQANDCIESLSELIVMLESTIHQRRKQKTIP